MRLREFKATFAILAIIGCIWLVAVGGLIFSMDTFSTGINRSQGVSDGTIYTAILLMLIVITVAVASPGLLLLRPIKLWRMMRADRRAITPRQRFRGRFYTFTSEILC